jgi:uncharacterized protein YndB with AHSA1/START domain
MKTYTEQLKWNCPFAMEFQNRNLNAFIYTKIKPMKLLEISYIDDFRWTPRSYRNQPKAELAETRLESAALVVPTHVNGGPTTIATKPHHPRQKNPHSLTGSLSCSLLSISRSHSFWL